jgi:preprotein translocase subunit SecG
MKTQWKRLLVKTTVWLAAEIILNLLGLDNLADYSEFVYEHEVIVLSQLAQQPTPSNI